MSAPKGHKAYNTKGEGGRPVTHDKDVLADKLVEWAQKEDSINLNAFCCSLRPLISPQRLCDFVLAHERLGEAMKIAKSFIAARRELRLNEGKLHVRAYDFNAAVYDYYVKQERREDKEHEIEMKSKNNIKNQIPDNDPILQGILSGINRIVLEQETDKKHAGSETPL